MAAPADMTTLNLSGTWTMNKTLSDNTDDVLTLQNIGWFTRKAIGLATITLAINHYKDDTNVEHIEIDQTLTGGIKGTTEIRILTWEERPHEDHLFGKVVGKTRRAASPADITDSFLSSNWEPEWIGEGLVENYVVSTENDWIAEQVWGFEKIAGEKRYVRHLKFTCPKRGNKLEKKMVYDYYGPLEKKEEFDPEAVV